MSTQRNHTARLNTAARYVTDLLQDSPADLLTIITDLDAKVWDALNALPETPPEGIEIETFEYWDDNENRKETEFYRVRNGYFEVKEDYLDTYAPPGEWYKTDWNEPGKIDLSTMLQILAYDRATRPEAYNDK